MSLPSGTAHAQALGAFVRAGGGASLEGRGQTPLEWVGPARFVEAGLVLPGEATYAVEFGLLASTISPHSQARRRAVLRSLGLESAVRVSLLDAPRTLDPVFLGGAFFVRTHERTLPGPPLAEGLVAKSRAPPGDRWVFGPRLGVGLRARPSPGLETALWLSSRIEIAPARLEMGVLLEVTVLPGAESGRD